MGKGIGTDIPLALLLQPIVPDGAGRPQAFLDIALLQQLAGLFCVMCPHTGETIGLQLLAYRKLVGFRRAEPSPGLLHFFGYAQQCLDMVAHFVRDHIRLGEITRRLEAMLEIV